MSLWNKIWEIIKVQIHEILHSISSYMYITICDRACEDQSCELKLH